MPARIGTRLGRMLNLNAGTTEDEFLHIADGSITPAGAFDLDASQNATFGGLFQVGYGNVGNRQMLMSKHVDGDDAGATAGWWIERRDSDNGSVVRVFLDDGTNQIDVETTEPLVDDGFAHIIVVTVDRTNDLLDVWWSPYTDSRSLVHVVQGTDISSLGSCANTAAFAAGAVYDGTPSNEDLLFRGGIAALWWADEVLPDATLDVFGRFQYYNPNDRRWVSFWTFSELNAVDWNRDNANDLTENNIVEADYGPGPDRCVEIASVSTSPSTAKTAGKADMFFNRLRPAILQEGYFWQVGAQGAPPLRLRRTTKGATDQPNFPLGAEIMTTNIGRYSCFASRDQVGTIGAVGTFRIYDNKVRDQGDGTAQDGIEAWEPLGKIADERFQNSSWDWASDVPSGGEPNYLIGYSATQAAPGELVCVDISDPSSPSIADSLAITGTLGVRRTIVDINDPDTVYVYGPNVDTFYSFDWTTKTALAANGTVVNALLGASSLNGWFVQVGTRIYLCTDAGLAVISVSTPTAPSWVTHVQTDPDNLEDDDDSLSGIIILPDGNLMTCGTDGHTSTGFGAIHVWDIKSDPDNPELIYREVGVSSRDYGGLQRLDRRGTTVFGLRDPGAITTLLAWGVADSKRQQFMAEYTLRNYDEDLFGVTTTMSLDRDTYTVNQDGSWWGFFKVDGGVGQVSLDVDFEPGGTVLQDPAAPWELEKLFADLGDLDFETDAVGTNPPTGWTKSGGANSDPEVRDEFGLTGQPPGALSPPQSCRLRIVGPDTDTAINLTLTPAAADLEAGRVYPLSLWYYVDGAGTFDVDNDLEIRIQETGGTTGTETRTFNPTRANKNRWHRFEFFYPLARSDRTGLTLRIRLLNSATHDVYIDSVRWGPGILVPLFSGRITTIGSGEGEADGASLGYGCSLIDKRWDLDRLSVDEEARAAATVEASLDALLAAYSRSKDGFTANNVYELGSHDRIEWGEDPPKLSEAINRLVTQGGGTWWLRDTDIWAVPPGYDVAPMPVNDVEFGWFNLNDGEDGAELVTTGTVTGDRSRSEIPESQWDDATLRARYGQVDYNIDPNADIQTAGQADDVRDYFQGLLGHPQLEGSFSVYNEPRLRPGQILPVQIEVRGLDMRAMIVDVQYAVAEGGLLQVDCTYALLIRDVLELLLPDQRNQANQRGNRQAVSDVIDDTTWGGLN